MRSNFRRGVTPPNSNAVTYETYSTDNGQTWQGLVQLFPDYQSSNWYFWRLSFVAAHKTNYRALLAESNKSGSNDLWYSENSGTGWSTPVLWRPLGASSPVWVQVSSSSPDNGRTVLYGFSEVNEPKKWYVQFRCIGGQVSSAALWPTVTGATPTAAVLVWEKGKPPRLFWKESASATQWYTDTLVAPSC
jgi:hypothetical protein